MTTSPQHVLAATPRFVRAAASLAVAGQLALGWVLARATRRAEDRERG